MNELIPKIVEQLADTVDLAEKYRLDQQHAKISKLYALWIDVQGQRLAVPYIHNRGIYMSFQTIVDNVDEEKKREEVASYSLIAVGILGLLRILHVDTNTVLAKMYSNPRHGDEQHLTKSSDIFTEITDTYRILEPAQDVAQTIHGSAIEWPLEIAQDEGRTFELIGYKAEALLTFSTGILKAQELLNNPQITEQRKIGIRSALAVLQARKARMNGDQGLMLRALINQVRTHISSPNLDRTKAIAGWSVQTGIREKRELWNPARIPNVLLGGGTYFLAKRAEKKE